MMSGTPYAEHSTFVSYNKVSFIAILGAAAVTNVTADAGFLRATPAVFGATINETPIYVPPYLTNFGNYLTSRSRIPL
jgi:hypothetical protein